MKLFLSLLIVSGCFLGGGSYQPAPRAGDENTKLVRGIWYNVNPSDWRHSRWYRSGDVTTPFRVVISTDDFACIMNNAVDEPGSGSYYKCPSVWRYPQRRHEN